MLRRKEKSEEQDHGVRVRVRVLNRMVSVSLIEKLRSGHRLEGGEKVNKMFYWKRVFQVEGMA